MIRTLALACILLASVALAHDTAPRPVLAESLQWTSPPDLPGLQAAWVIGTAQKAGAYVVRVKLASGARIPPHVHPDERVTTVLTGTIHVGFGKVFDEARVVEIPSGASYVAPANVPHFVWARNGQAMYQESGIGPTDTVLVK